MLSDVSVVTVIVTLGIAPFVFVPYFLFVARYDGDLSIPRPAKWVLGAAFAAGAAAAFWGPLPLAFATPFAVAAGVWTMQNPRTAAYYDQKSEAYTGEIGGAYEDEDDVPFGFVLTSWLSGAGFVLVGIYLAVGTLLGTVG